MDRKLLFLYMCLFTQIELLYANQVEQCLQAPIFSCLIFSWFSLLISRITKGPY